MTVPELFKEHGDEYLKFDRIPETARLHQCSEICGMMKLFHFLKHASLFSVTACGHTVALCQLKELREEPSEADVIYLLRCGVTYDVTYECFTLGV